MRSSGRIFMALSGLAVAAAVAYALITYEWAGAVMLGIFSIALLYVGTVLLHAGPYDHAEVDEDAEPELGPEHVSGPSWWPIVMALGAALLLAGLKFAPIVMGVGAGIFLLAAVGWFVQVGRQHEEHAAEGVHGAAGTHGVGSPEHQG